MDRRDFLLNPVKKKGVALNTSVKIKASRPTSGLETFIGSWTESEVTHLLKRVMFGAKKADVDYFKTRTLQQTVAELLNPASFTRPDPIKEYATTTNAAAVPDTAILTGTTWVNDYNGDGTVQSQRRTSYRKWFAGNLINQDRSVLEKLTMFWIDLLGNQMDTVGNANWIYKQNVLIRSNALGNYKQLIRDISTDVAMLRYLNGYVNRGTAPDENYARELMELFTLGKGPDSKYTENDVKEAAKVLTGWQINSTTYTSYFTLSRHNTTNKTFSAFFKNKVITGRNNATAGATELNELVDMIFDTDEVGRYIARRLYRWYVYYDIDDNAEENVIKPLGKIFKDNKYEIKPMLQALFSSAHFYDAFNKGCVIKSPADYVIGLLREMEVKFPDLTDWDTNYGFWNTMFTHVSNMGQRMHDPPNVSGMPAYYQEPLFHEIWINADSLPKRVQYSDIMVNSGYSRNSKKIIIDVIAFTKLLSNPGDPVALIDESIALLFRNELSAALKQQIKVQIILSGQESDYYWTNAWMAYLANPTTANTTIVKNRLVAFYLYLFNLPEYHLI